MLDVLRAMHYPESMKDEDRLTSQEEGALQGEPQDFSETVSDDKPRNNAAPEAASEEAGDAASDPERENSAKKPSRAARRRKRMKASEDAAASELHNRLPGDEQADEESSAGASYGQNAEENEGDAAPLAAPPPVDNDAPPIDAPLPIDAPPEIEPPESEPPESEPPEVPPAPSVPESDTPAEMSDSTEPSEALQPPAPEVRPEDFAPVTTPLSEALTADEAVQHEEVAVLPSHDNEVPAPEMGLPEEENLPEERMATLEDEYVPEEVAAPEIEPLRDNPVPEEVAEDVPPPPMKEVAVPLPEMEVPPPPPEAENVPLPERPASQMAPVEMAAQNTGFRPKGKIVDADQSHDAGDVEQARRAQKSSERARQLGKTKNWYQDRFQTLRIQRNILFIMMIIAVFTMVITAMRMSSLMEQKVFEPFVIEVEDKTGVVTQVSQKTLEKYQADEAVIRYFLVKYLRAREGFDPATYKYDYNQVVRLLSAPDVYGSFIAYLRGDPRSPLKVAGNKRREVAIKSLRFMDARKREVQVRIAVSEIAPRTNQVTDVYNYFITIKHDFVALDLSSTGRYVNPLGYQVVSYSKEEERFD